MIQLALLAEQVGVNERTLRRAVNQGTLRASRPSPRRLDLPLAERQYVRRSWPLLAALRAALRTEHNVRLALLFGSAARGTDTQDSDVDIVVELRDPSLDRVVDLSSKLSAIVGRPVDVLRLEDVLTEPFVLDDVLADGRVIVDRVDRWPRLRRHGASLLRRGRGEAAGRAGAALKGVDRLLSRSDGRDRTE